MNEKELDVALSVEAKQFSVEPGRLPGGRGSAWLSSGFELFKKAPLMWMVTIVVYVVLMAVLSFIPVLPNLLQPVFSAGFAIICQGLCERGEFNIEDLFGGFKRNFVALIAVGAVVLVGTFFTLFIAMGLGAGGILAGGQMSASAPVAAAMLLPALIISLVLLPLIMASWFAPILIVFHDVPLLVAMKASMKACWINSLAFLWYGLILLLLSFVAAIPFMLGFLVLAPVFIASVYVSYREIFFVAQQTSDSKEILL